MADWAGGRLRFVRDGAIGATPRILAFVAVGCVWHLACGDTPAITDPGPLPSPSPAVAPIPPPVPLRIEGNRFVPDIFGIIGCCDDPRTEGDEGKRDGWPLATRAWLERIKADGANWTHVRLGPSTEEHEGPGWAPYLKAPNGQYDLTQWSPEYWARVRQFVQDASDVGIYAEVDLVGSWTIRHGLSPWTAGNNVQGISADVSIFRSPPPPYVMEWLDKAIAETAWYPGIIFQTSNEGWLVDAAPGWELAIRDKVRATGRLICTNSDDPRIERMVDCANRHQDEAQPAASYPVSVNEYSTDRMTVERWCKHYRIARRAGTYMHLWRGEWSEEEYERAVACARESR